MYLFIYYIIVVAEKENKILSEWLIENFPYTTNKEDIKTEHPVVLTTQNNKSSPNKKDSINSARMSKLKNKSLFNTQ